MAPEVCAEHLVDIDEVSLEEDSGWRAIDPARVQELKDAFMRGEYGQNILRKPSLLFWQGAPKISAKDGKILLADGKATFAALKALRTEYHSLEESEEPLEEDAYSETLVRAFTDGVDCAGIEWDDDDDCLVLAWATHAHDLESNKYKATSLKNLVSVALKYKARQPGGSWSQTQAALEQVYGTPQRMFVYRMVVAAQMLEPEVLEALELAKLTPNHIHENKYFLGMGAANAPKRLSAKWKLAAIRAAGGDLDAGKTLSRVVFENDYCAPLREAEKWVNSKRKFYGALAQIPAFARVEAYLQSPKARVPVLGCIRVNMRLEGTGPDNGVEQCRILVKELEKLRTAPSQAKETEGQPGAAGPPTREETEFTPGGEEEQAAETRPAIAVPEEEERDHALEAANNKLDLAMAQFGHYRNWEHLADALPAQLVSSDSVLILIDAPTSRPKVAARRGAGGWASGGRAGTGGEEWEVAWGEGTRSVMHGLEPRAKGAAHGLEPKSEGREPLLRDAVEM